MLPVSELRFAQYYPFSKTAQMAVKNSNLSLDNVPSAVMQRAKLMLLNALTGKEYRPLAQESSELIMNEILAFPVAKILLSFSKNSSYFKRFAAFVSENAFNRLELEKSEILLDLAQELSLSFELPEEKEFFVSIPVVQFLKIPQSAMQMHLINQKLSKGKLFLTQQEFARFLSEAVKLKVFQSLPVDVKKTPEFFKKISSEIFNEISSKQKQILVEALHGKVEAENFPPCFSELYSRLNSGQQLNHLGNFALATFLIAISMPRDKILEAYKKAPNYDERTSTYHIDRMSKGKKYTPASCNTMRSYGLCIQNGALCFGIKNPLMYYRRKIFKSQNFSSAMQNEHKEAGK